MERFHRQLKSSLHARLRSPNWSDELPWTMLGICTAPKEDLGASSAELVYGYPLTVPGDFLATSPTETPATLLPALRDIVHALVPVPTSHHGLVPSSMPQVLHHSAFVFVRRSAKSPLKSPYEGPFCVLHHGDKAFLIDMGGRQELVTVDCLKAAHLDLDQPIQVAQPPCRSHPPRSPGHTNSISGGAVKRRVIHIDCQWHLCVFSFACEYRSVVLHRSVVCCLLYRHNTLSYC